MSCLSREIHDRFQDILERIDFCRRSLPPEASGTAEIYLQAAYGCALHARDALLAARGDDVGLRWRSRLSANGWVQAGERGVGLSWTERSADETLPPTPDLGASLIRSERLPELATSACFSALLASALAQHRWMHLATGCSWTSSWVGAEALVRALNCGRPFPKVTAAEMRGTIDRRVAEELAALGWRKISSPTLP